MALGIAKLAGAIVPIMPGPRLVKEWAYAGFDYAWIVATIAHYLPGDGIKAITPVVVARLADRLLSEKAFKSASVGFGHASLRDLPHAPSFIRSGFLGGFKVFSR